MNERQLGTSLAALRKWQRETDWELRAQDDIATDLGDFEPLNDQEIDELCETLYVRHRKVRAVLEISNGVIDTAYADKELELLIIDRDETAETVLPDGNTGYSTTLVTDGNDPTAVNEAFETYG